MKRHCALLAALLLPLCAAAADQVWRADLATTEVRNLYLRHGESAELTARLYLRGTPYAPTNAVAYYQTNGMAQAWWSAPCSIASNTVSVAWTPALDPGADLVSLLIRLDDSAYRAAAMLYLRPSPGAEPNILPAPTQWIDFDKIAWTNAPWALAADVATNFVPVTGGSFLSTNVFMPTGFVDEAFGTATGTGIKVPAGETVALHLSLLDTTWDVATNAYPETIHARVSLEGANIHESADAEFFQSGTGYGTRAFGGELQIDPWNMRWFWFHLWYGNYVLGGTLDPQSGNPIGYSRLAMLADLPGNYETVSNRAMTALQSFTEGDPFFWRWAETNRVSLDISTAQSAAIGYASRAAEGARDVAVQRAKEYTDTAVGGVTASSIGALTTETDPTVPAWAKTASKPAYTATEVGAATPAALAAAAIGATNYTDAAVAGVTAASIGALTAETDPTVPAWAKADNPPSGGADMGQVSNLVAVVVAEAGASAAATETWRIVLADHQRRLDALEDADGIDALTEAQAEQLIQDRMATLLHDIEEEWGETSGCIPIQTTTCNSTTISANTSGVAATLSPLYATRFYASTASDRTLGFSSFSGVGNNPCILILERFSSVSWPSGACIETAYSDNSGTPNVYAIYKLNGVVYAKKLYP